MKKLRVLYGGKADLLNQNVTPDTAMIVTEWWAEHVAEIKTMCPGIKILGYRPLTGICTYYQDYDWISQHHPEWFARCETTGKRIVHNHDWLLMDLLSHGWRHYLAGWVAEQRTIHPLYDGVFLDCAFTALNPVLFRREGDPKPPAQHANIAEYARLYPEAAKLAVELIEGYKVVLPEGLALTCPDVNGGAEEGFTCAPWDPAGYRCTKDRWNADIARAQAVLAADKDLLLISGAKAGSDDRFQRDVADFGRSYVDDGFHVYYAFNLG